jgi:hypothetical protein
MYSLRVEEVEEEEEEDEEEEEEEEEEDEEEDDDRAVSLPALLPSLLAASLIAPNTSALTCSGNCMRTSKSIWLARGMKSCGSYSSSGSKTGSQTREVSTCMLSDNF